MTRRDVWTAALLGSAASTLYLSFTTKFFVFEGLARAMPIAAGNFADVFLGNYLLYGFVGWCFQRLLELFGFTPMAVYTLQVMDCLIGGAGVALFYLTLRRLEVERLAAGLWSCALSVCCAYWLWSTDAQNYIWSTFLLGLNFHFLARDASGKRLHPAVLGALHGLAILGHIVNGIFGVAGLWHVRRTHGRSGLMPMLQYAAASAAVAISAYAFVLLAFVHPGSLHGLRQWFVGSLKTGSGGLRWHGGFGLESLRLWLRMSVNILVAFPDSYPSFSGGAAAEALLTAARGLALAFAVKLALSWKSLTGPRRHMATLCAIWLASYACVFTSWEPMTMVYRVSDLVAVTALLALGAEAGASRGWRWAAAALVLCLGLGNFLEEVRPRTVPENNALLMRMRFVRSSTPEDSWVATPESQGGGEELYLPFFAERRPVVLSVYRDQPAVLAGKLDRILGGGQPVFVSSLVLQDDFWKKFFAAYRPAEAASDGEGFALYRLEAPKAPTRGARRRS